MVKKRFRTTVALYFPELHRYDTMFLSLSSTPRQVYLIILFFLFVSFFLYFILNPTIYLYFTLASIFRTTFINLCQILGSYDPVYEYYYLPGYDSVLSGGALPSFCRNLMLSDSRWNSKSIPLRSNIIDSVLRTRAGSLKDSVSNLPITTSPPFSHVRVTPSHVGLLFLSEMGN
jgi:hypothetical protein